ncbi:MULTISPECIES: D-2-hydroxyacid dehydrogenase family protein [Rhizobium]|uniref:D-2-hydroxyacid dehydrogenase family protein n=1 Tax=Rhizobium leguminosarum bv. viciae TaxID=387 RepID=A0A8G2IQX7_RHILV|nr:D-2-hydroxyacid dehydrogenase family protein [Rhizobium leguminosarum]MBB4510512.1 phosphoglycerate dehydrogenase-like enzyme [Rhizobium leguminosarum]NKK11545.1 D-2-hydroxyacid dehydrogenase family protein [Rhizobium leguminosarum bv. viciae]NKK25539.1 D-2-hydroxyacid dehydrogenase family protein [Rhizobium leguminosarum bv. viciae]TBX84974.1 D-2-hydroxyacid dehydrogenase family protein [Rhizobium leguminosarum bv. viciae]TBZ09371.1 D-2-hydroxyacid dehydrogenase family protein [Rhizobium l
MNIAILDDYLGVSQQVADWEGLKSRANVFVFHRPLALLDEAACELADFDILCTLRERMPISGELIRRLPRLKYIVVTGKRYDTVDVRAAAELGIPVSNTPVSGVGAGGVAELVWGLIFAATRHIASEDRGMRGGGWQTQAGTTVGGKVLGILGLGGLGRRVAEIGRVFGMEVRAWSQNMTTEQAEAAGARFVSKAELFATSDIVTVHLALSDRTRGIVGATELNAMKSSAYLINTARGAIVDEAALIAALRSKTIAGAGLDVYEQEPLPAAHPFRSFPNVVITPHLGYFTKDMLGSYYGDAVRLMESFLDGRPERVVNMGLEPGS